MTTEQSAGTTGTGKETLATELKGMLGDANRRLHEAGHAVAEEVVTTRDAMVRQALCASGSTDRYVHRNPWTIVGLAAAAGLLVGALLGRR